MIKATSSTYTHDKENHKLIIQTPGHKWNYRIVREMRSWIDKKAQRDEGKASVNSTMLSDFATKMTGLIDTEFFINEDPEKLEVYWSPTVNLDGSIDYNWEVPSHVIYLLERTPTMRAI